MGVNLLKHFIFKFIKALKDKKNYLDSLGIIFPLIMTFLRSLVIGTNRTPIGNQSICWNMQIEWPFNSWSCDYLNLKNDAKIDEAYFYIKKKKNTS